MKIKKILKITAIVLLLFIGLLAATPVLFKGKIIEIIKTNVNKNLNAKLDFTDTDISLFRNFPKASVKVSDISLINYEPFVGDTLFAAKEVNLTMSLSELFNSANEPMKIDYFSVDGANVAILVDEQGNANYDIAKQTDITEDKTASETVGFNLSVQGYDITNSTFLSFTSTFHSIMKNTTSFTFFTSTPITLSTFIIYSRITSKTICSITLLFTNTKAR